MLAKPFAADDLTPFWSYSLCSPFSISSDSAYVSKLAPTYSEQESVLDRYRRGIFPTLKDFKQYPVHPLRGCSIRSDGPTTADLFVYYSEASHSASFTLKTDASSEAALIRINKSALRAGELLTCAIKLHRTSVEVFKLIAELVRIETVNEPFRSAGGASAYRQVVYRDELVCWLHRQIGFQLTIPMDASCTLYADLISVKWSLELTFTCTPRSADAKHQLSTSPVQGQNSLIDCSLPIRILPNKAISHK